MITAAYRELLLLRYRPSPQTTMWEPSELVCTARDVPAWSKTSLYPGVMTWAYIMPSCGHPRLASDHCTPSELSSLKSPSPCSYIVATLPDLPPHSSNKWYTIPPPHRPTLCLTALTPQ